MHYLHLMYLKCLRVMNWHLAQMETKDENVSDGAGRGTLLMHMLVSECKPPSHSSMQTSLF